MTTILSLLNYGLLSIFGITLTFLFVGVENNRSNRRHIPYFIAFLLLLQLASWQLFGYEFTRKIYPVIAHLPLAIYICIRHKKSWDQAFISVLSAYLCCQTPRWFATVVLYFFDNENAYLIMNSLTILPVFYILKKYVISSVNTLMNLSKRSLALFGIVPLMYYIFDYATTVYTNILYQGIEIAVVFMPSIVSIFYFVFVLIYYHELQRRSEAENERIMLTAQIKQAKNQLSAFMEMQERTAIYRHDMRHHLSLISGYLTDKEPQKALEYIATTQININAISPIRYCKNITVNLILSCFAEKAREKEISFSAEANLTEELSIPENELCALLSNGLENAIEASGKMIDKKARVIRINCQIHKNKLLILIENNYSGELEMKNGLPLSQRPGHGFGVKSILMIANKYQGYCSYTAQNGVFTLRIVLPLTMNPDNQ